jgi:hypothetical protein
MRVAVLGSSYELSADLITHVYNRFDDFALQLVKEIAPASKHLFTFEFTEGGYEDPEEFTGFLFLLDLADESSFEYIHTMLVGNSFLQELNLEDVFTVLVAFTRRGSPAPLLHKFQALAKNLQIKHCLASLGAYQDLVDTVKGCITTLITNFYSKNPAGNVSIIEQDENSEVF